MNAGNKAFARVSVTIAAERSTRTSWESRRSRRAKPDHAADAAGEKVEIVFRGVALCGDVKFVRWTGPNTRPHCR